MKYKLTILFLLLSAVLLNAQWEIRGGMGVLFGTTPSLNDYLINFSGTKGTDFSTSVTFSGEVGYFITPTQQISLETAYQLSSNQISAFIGSYEFNYSTLSPSLVYHIVIPNPSYYFKFGAGAGPRFVSAEERLPGTFNIIDFTSTGVGFLISGNGNTRLSGNLFVNVGAELRYDLISELKSGSVILNDPFTNKNVNLNTFSVALRLGLAYNF
jgi:hypothetical protein